MKAVSHGFCLLLAGLGVLQQPSALFASLNSEPPTFRDGPLRGLSFRVLRHEETELESSDVFQRRQRMVMGIVDADTTSHPDVTASRSRRTRRSAKFGDERWNCRMPLGSQGGDHS